jgi:hypothetical protein
MNEKQKKGDSAIPPSASIESGADSPRAMEVTELMRLCAREFDRYRRGSPCTDEYGLELLRRATDRRDALAWEALRHSLHETVATWVRSHPQRDTAFRFDSADNYVAQAFARFWQAAVCHQQVEFSSMAAALAYLRASVNGAILDTIRAYSRPKEMPLLDADEADEAGAAHQEEENEVWAVISTLLPGERERRVAYLLYHCGLKPREIVRYCPQEFSEIQEIYRLRRQIIERLVRNADRLRWRLNMEG